MPKRILIVDDQRDVAMLLHHWMDVSDYEVQEVYSGSEALKRVFKESFDLVLLDYEMRDIKGDRLCLMIREDDRTKTLPVFIVTAHIEVDEKTFRQYGATEVFYKPVDGRDLLDRISKQLKSS